MTQSLLSLPGVTVIQQLPDMISESECAIINNTLHPELNRQGTEQTNKNHLLHWKGLMTLGGLALLLRLVAVVAVARYMTD